MALTLISTVAGTTSNSYVATVAEADSIASMLLLLTYLQLDSTGWDGATDDTKTLALIIAAGRVDNFKPIADPYSSTQALAWPRRDGVIPDVVKWAQVAEAISLLNAPSENTTMAAAGIQSFTTGDESVTFSSVAKAASDRPASRAAEILLSASGLINANGAGSVYLMR